MVTIVLLVLMVPSWFTIQGVLPAPLEIAFRLIPTYHLSAALDLALAGKASLARVWGNLAVLAGSVIVAFAVVVWTLSREDR